MKRLLIPISTAALTISLFAGGVSAKSNVDVTKYTVGVNSDSFAQPHESVANEFPFGFVEGFGSALALKSFNKGTGEMEFYALTDRGPNGKE